jgi:citrate lyase beta subunit
MTTRATLNAGSLRAVFSSLKKANAAAAKAWPGDSAERQPVHTVYGGAHLFKSDTAPKLGTMALKSLQQFAPDAKVFGEAIGLRERLRRPVYERVVDKIKREPVEDFRIDFEDGYGNRPDEEEDHHAIAAAEEVRRGVNDKSLPPYIGIRIKPFNPELHARSIRTLDLFITTLAGRDKRLPSNFIVTLPKLTSPAQVAALADILALLEKKLKLAPRSLMLELMIETTQSIFQPDGSAAVRALVDAAKGRCRGAHFGTYDYTAGCNITASHQRMDHPVCDFAKHVMQVQLAGTGVTLSDGATNVMPVGPHRSGQGAALTAEQIHENVQAVHRAWKLHYDHIQHSLTSGYYQGWDLHPAQLPTRYAAVYAFFLDGLQPASARLRNFIEKAAQATLVGDVFDDAATGQGLLNYFLRGLSCGAFTEDEGKLAGLTPAELQTRSFLRILAGRRKAAA